MVRDKILENYHNDQLSFLTVYRQHESLKAIDEITELVNFVEKTFLYILRRLRTRTDERTQRKLQNSRNTLKNQFFDQVSRVVCYLYVLAFFTGKSERVDILDLEVSNDGLSFDIVKSKIKNLAEGSFIQSWSVEWQTLSLVIFRLLTCLTHFI